MRTTMYYARCARGDAEGVALQTWAVIGCLVSDPGTEALKIKIIIHYSKANSDQARLGLRTMSNRALRLGVLRKERSLISFSSIK